MEHIDPPARAERVAVLDYRGASPEATARRPRQVVLRAVVGLALMGSVAWWARTDAHNKTYGAEDVLLTVGVAESVAALAVAVWYFRLNKVGTVIGATLGILATSGAAALGFFAASAVEGRHQDQLLILLPLLLAVLLAIGLLAFALRWNWAGLTAGALVGSVGVAILTVVGLLDVVLVR